MTALFISWPVILGLNINAKDVVIYFMEKFAIYNYIINLSKETTPSILKGVVVAVDYRVDSIKN
tara:strand:+ start:509 stop:700 length:192 start_codon:yes stop_codon:yes gene_type:complete